MNRSPAQSDDLARAVRAVQTCYPRVYLACHTRHQRKRSTSHRISVRDSAILAHLDERTAVTPAALAAHLDVSPSTLSEALKRLANLGFVSQPDGSGTPRRRTSVLLTDEGAAAVRDTSVLEPDRLTRALEGLSRAELRAVARGMQTLGDACLRHSAPARSQRRIPK